MNPDVAAAADRARRWVDVAGWTAIVLGLAFTAVNVQVFAAAGAPIWSLGWCAAWLLDPIASVLLLAVVRAEQVTSRWQIAMPWQVGATKWAAFLATLVMNVWAPVRDLIPSGIVLHAIPPVFVLLAAEVSPVLRDRLTEAVKVAAASVDTPVPPSVHAESGESHAVTPPSEGPDSVRTPALPQVIKLHHRQGGAAPEPEPFANPSGTLSAPATTPDGTRTEPAPPPVGDDDAERLADLRAYAAELGKMPGRDAVKARYGCGSSTANRLREQAARPQLAIARGGA